MQRAPQASLLFVLFCVVATGTSAQTTSVATLTSSQARGMVCTQTVSPAPAHVVPGEKAPYSAEQESTNVQTLSDGTHITHTPTRSKIYRDSEGRTRYERPFCVRRGIEPQGLVIDIRDPVAGFAYILDEQNHVAHRFALEAKGGTNNTRPAPMSTFPETAIKLATPPQNYPRPTMTTESLGSQTMEGVLVEGTKTTRVTPEGLMGNDRPITEVTETWAAPSLGIVVLRKDTSVRIGEMTTRLTNIDVSNPILSLFQPPADYKIVDETGSVTLTFTRD